jgi:hypothetical protein
MKLHVAMVNNSSDTPNNFPVHAGQEILHIGMLMERMFFRREELFEIKKKRRNPGWILAV